MEDYNCEMINIFNKNFETKDFKNIINLYKKEIFMIEYFEESNFKQEYKFRHPLFKNYNYCFFCEKKEKTKYTKNLEDIHIPLKTKTIGEFLFSNKIKLRPIYNKKLKLAKRRFIKSCDNINSIDEINNNKNYGDSDTELCIYKEKNDDHKDKYKKNKKINNKNLFKKNNKKSINTFVDKIYSPFSAKNRIYKIEKNFKNNDLIQKAEEKKLNSNNITQNSGNININLDEIKTNYNMEDSEKNSNTKSFDKSIKINDKNIKENSQEKISKKQSINIINKRTNNNDNTKEVEVQDSSLINSDIKISISEKREKEEENDSKNSFDKINDDKSVKSAKSNKSNIILNNFVNETKKFFGFGRQSTKPKDNARRTLTGHSKHKNGDKINCAENNCSICLQEIKEKFTLICGDFFCTDCIRQSLLTAMKKISNLDLLSCPTCNEKIEVNTIKKLLTEEEFNHYNYLITKIEGYRKEEYIPCPYPDCPDFADINQFNNTNIVICQNGHTFCKKCLELLDKNIKEKEHECFKNISLEEQKTTEFLKKNRNFRKCPKCKNYVVREGGECNNMTCTNIWCGYEFCWICNGKYEESHYKNPISMCFGLGDIGNDRKLLKYSRIRLFRCILIFCILIFFLLPLIVTFFSIFEAVIYVIAFVLDGSAMKNIKLRSKTAHKFFYKIAYVFYFCISIAFIPLGYFSLAGLMLFIPFLCIYNKIKKKNGEYLD